MRLRRIASTPAGWSFFGLTVPLIAWLVHWEVVSSDFYRTALFRWRKADFEAVKDMLEHDRSIALIDCDRSEPEKLSETPQRIAEYRHHLSRIGCPGVRYLFAGGKDTDFSWDINQSSAIMFIPGNPKLPADGYGHIEGDWYLAYRRGFP